MPFTRFLLSGLCLWNHCPTVELHGVYPIKADTDYWGPAESHFLQRESNSRVLSPLLSWAVAQDTYWDYQRDSLWVAEDICACVCPQSCLALCDPIDCSPPRSSVHGIIQARILEEYFLFPTLRDLPSPGIEPASPVSSALAGRFFTTSTTWEARERI